MNALRRLAAGMLVALGLAACATYDPMDESWRAATGALEDAGLTIVNADRATGTLRGTRGTVEGVISVKTRPDGRVGVEITSRDPDRLDPNLTDRLTQAYQRRMGR